MSGYQANEYQEQTTGQQQHGHNAYASHNATVLSDREIDARALVRCADRLQQSLKNKDDMKEYSASIRHNQKLWTIFQVALADPENPLATDLKITLLSLSRYVDKTSFRAVTEFMPALVESLANINRIIAVGLMKKNEAIAQAAAAQQVAVAQPAPGAINSVMTSI